MPTRKLLLISSSRVHGTDFLEHCTDAIKTHFANSESVLFIPYALADHDKYESIVATAFEKIGLTIKSIHHAADPIAAINNAGGIFIGGGNSFRLLKTLCEKKLVQPIREAVASNTPYMGSSAGTNMACPTIRTTNDMPIVEPPTFDSLNLIPFQINPHFIDADPNSKHKGETREQRLAEFHEENSTAVVGLREGSWLEIDGNACKLAGSTGMMLFEAGNKPQEIGPGADLTELMNQSA